MNTYIVMFSNVDQNCGEPECAPDAATFRIVAGKTMNEAEQLAKDDIHGSDLWLSSERATFLVGPSRRRGARVLTMADAALDLTRSAHAKLP